MEINILAGISAVIPTIAAINWSSSSEDDDDNDIMNLALTTVRHIMHKHRRNKRIKVQHFVTNVVWQYSDETFRSHFRLNRTSCEELLNMLQLHRPESKLKRPRLDIKRELLIFLWCTANQECFRAVSDRFNVGIGHCHRVFLGLAEEVAALSIDIIKWPTGNDMERVLQEFEDMYEEHRFPGVIGCIDGTHIEIPKPKDDNGYYNRNKYHSIILQGICDAKGAFIDVYTGWPGSVNDARVWQHSPIYEKLTTQPNFLPQNIHILGDSAYPLSPHVMVPYKDNGHLSPRQTNFNYLLSKKRVIIENAFGWLKCRFRKLKYLDMTDLARAKHVIVAACVLHNIATWQRTQEEGAFEVDEGLGVPQAFENHLLHDGGNVFANAARNKRERIAQMLFHQ